MEYIFMENFCMFSLDHLTYFHICIYVYKWLPKNCNSIHSFILFILSHALSNTIVLYTRSQNKRWYLIFTLEKCHRMKLVTKRTLYKWLSALLIFLDEKQKKCCVGNRAICLQCHGFMGMQRANCHLWLLPSKACKGIHSEPVFWLGFLELLVWVHDQLA